MSDSLTKQPHTIVKTCTTGYSQAHRTEQNESFNMAGKHWRKRLFARLNNNCIASVA